MHHRLVYQSDFLTLEYDAVEDYLHAVWAPEQTTETIRQGYEEILRYLQLEYCHRLLDNQQAIQGIWVDQADWFATDWYPRAAQAGLRSHTVAYATDFFGRRSTQEALERVPGGLVAGFDDVDAARKALLAL